MNTKFAPHVVLAGWAVYNLTAITLNYLEATGDPLHSPHHEIFELASLTSSASTTSYLGAIRAIAPEQPKLAMGELVPKNETD